MRRAGPYLICCALLMAACTDTAATTAPPTAAPATTAPTRTPAPTTCPTGPPVAPDAQGVETISADLDVDGLDDTVQTYLSPAEDRWHLRVEWGGGGGGHTDQVIEDSFGAAPARPIGPFDVEGDGTPELFVTVGSGASTVLVGLFDVAGCELVRVTLGGEAAVFPVGASVQHVSGLSCGPVGDLDRLFASFVDEQTYEGGVEPFSLTGSELTGGPGDGATFTAEEAGALAVFDCGDLPF